MSKVHALAFHNNVSWFIPSAHVHLTLKNSWEDFGLLPHPGYRLLRTKDSTVAATAAPIRQKWWLEFDLVIFSATCAAMSLQMIVHLPCRATVSKCLTITHETRTAGEHGFSGKCTRFFQNPVALKEFWKLRFLISGCFRSRKIGYPPGKLNRSDFDFQNPGIWSQKRWSNHIDGRLNFIQGLVLAGGIRILRVGTENQHADILTKVLWLKNSFVHRPELMNLG